MKKGMILLLTVLIVSAVLSIGLGIGTVLLVETRLTLTGKESQIAFYAADAGAECAIYWDIMQNAFATSTTSNINCAGNQINGVGGPGGISTFSLSFDNGSCTAVIIDKNNGTEIESLGMNKCPYGNRSIQRGIRVVID